MFVTTGGRTDDKTIEKAKQAAEYLDLRYVPRLKRSVASLQRIHGGDCLVIGRQRLELYKVNQAEPFFFHPNVAMLRIKRLLKGKPDPFVYAAGIQNGSSVLDCTLGLGADAIVASFVAGKNGNVQGIEENPLLSFVVEEGLEEWSSGNEAIDHALRRVIVKTSNHLDVLRSCSTGSFDVVYFDPMFEENIAESDGIRSLTYFAARDELLAETIEEAKRVAKQKVVLKDYFRSERFARFGFQVIVRKTSKFHFGYIDVQANK
ncbi:class I SAM-dependent methyltransferase [Bacillus sp. CECT 9360]|uniref:class I SAM-dependent methyltransferase n=1 Tax=Bacillus sp. CECT 9360 TaxID=2845821 RepID=UPI001E5873D9|nr:class I SAM-dependent methyltransferase [Bacillus sp. CECT 9360]CAH0347378.1 Ribosomal RNA small subunit methyltransferase J [Bacillus sp. CECT 9360]